MRAKAQSRAKLIPHLLRKNIEILRNAPFCWRVGALLNVVRARKRWSAVFERIHEQYFFSILQIVTALRFFLIHLLIGFRILDYGRAVV